MGTLVVGIFLPTISGPTWYDPEIIQIDYNGVISNDLGDPGIITTPWGRLEWRSDNKLEFHVDVQTQSFTNTNYQENFKVWFSDTGNNGLTTGSSNLTINLDPYQLTDAANPGIGQTLGQTSSNYITNNGLLVESRYQTKVYDGITTGMDAICGQD